MVAINAAQVGAPFLLRPNMTGETVSTIIKAVKKVFIIVDVL
jgi:hypothetical protein